MDKPKCPKIGSCLRLIMVLDKDLPTFEHYQEEMARVCRLCDSRETAVELRAVSVGGEAILMVPLENNETLYIAMPLSVAGEVRLWRRAND